MYLHSNPDPTFIIKEDKIKSVPSKYVIHVVTINMAKLDKSGDFKNLFIAFSIFL
ncbi:hypothetical protein EV197_2855 [Aquimarina brevivitae]|uniref:Uncharacterized protein n=1 Tax=Aquimarina brevivitae TaxID=323412 RepID=A0A4V2F5B3_9FLAO|nr:hypothetical protein EV197_2855 [Aquimarina brevivitae]